MLTEKVKASQAKQEEETQQTEEAKPTKSGRPEKSTFEKVMTSPVANQIGKELVRGVFGMLFGSVPRRTTSRRKW
jgi:hypothetical protein